MNSTLSTSELNPIENHDDFIIFWLDSSIDIPEKLEAMTDFLRKSNSIEECETLLARIQTDCKVLFIMADYYEYVTYFNQYSQIQSIYILNKNLQENDFFDKRLNPKLVHVFHDESALIQRLRQDMIFTYRYDLPINTCWISEINNDQSIMKLDNNKLFCWNQAILYYLMDTSNICMDDLRELMKKQCGLEYENNITELKKIYDFNRTCTSDNILEWYTKDSFVYRIVNKAFRSRNLDLICKVRYAIILLYEKLKQLSIQQQENNFTIVYRAQCMKKHELELLRTSIGQLISTNTIMSTTQDRNLAIIYQNRYCNAAEASVMLEINIEIGSNPICPFADISQESRFPDESEVLFFAGAVFRIDSVNVEDDSTYTVQLTLSNEKLNFIEQLTNAFKVFTSLEIERYNISSFIDDAYSFKKYYLYLTKRKLSRDEIIQLLMRIFSNDLINHVNNKTTSIDYYKQLLVDESFHDNTKHVLIHTIIGKNYVRLKQYDDAFIHYGLAFSFLDDQNRLAGETYHLLGDIWKDINQNAIALSCYKQAEDIIVKHDNKEKHLDRLYTKISEIYSSQNNNDYATIYNLRAKDILEFYKQNPKFIDENLIIMHLQQFGIELSPHFLAQVYDLYVNGMHALGKQKFSQGLIYLKQAEEMFKNHYFLYDKMRVSILIIIYEHQALAYFGLKDYRNATIALKKATDLRMIYKL